MPGYDHLLRLIRATQSVKPSLSAFFRRCYGTELTSNAILAWSKDHKVEWHDIAPGRPMQNGYVERYNRTVRHEWLDQYIIESIEEAQEFATQWLWTYNNERPNMGICGITPAQKLKMAA